MWYHNGVAYEKLRSGFSQKAQYLRRKSDYGVCEAIKGYPDRIKDKGGI